MNCKIWTRTHTKAKAEVDTSARYKIEYRELRVNS